MRVPVLAFAALSPLALVGGCSRDPGDTLKTVRMTEQAQIEAIQAKDLAGALRVYDDNATLIATGSAPLIGKEAIRARFRTMLADPNFKVDYKPGHGWASGAEDLAVTTGTATFAASDPKSGKPVTTAVEYQTVWKKGEKLDESVWKIVSDYEPARARAELALADR